MANITELERIINTASQVAVATLTQDGQAPDVRIVLGVFDPTGNQVLFMSATQAEKVREIAAHQRAAFATPAVGQGDFARVRAAEVTQIEPTSAQLALYNNKYPDTAKYAAHSAFFALRFKQAEVTVDGTESIVEL